MVALVIADIHANLDALQAVLRDSAGEYSEVWCLGDIVGYGPEPSETLAMVKSLEPIAVAGNHDRAVTGQADLEIFSAGARDAVERHRPLLNGEYKRWLDELPEVLERHSVTLCHGSLVDPVWDYILTPLDAARTMDQAATSIVISGHTHFPVIWGRSTGASVEQVPWAPGKEVDLNGMTVVLNPGSVGQSRNGSAAAHYALLDTQRRSVTMRRVSYPVRRTMKKLQKLGYPEESVVRYRLGR